MKAGRELDALVAEKVMGMKRDPVYGITLTANMNYSTDIAAAWEVMERARGWEYPQRKKFSESLLEYICFGFESVPEVGEAILYIAPRPICLSALKAVGVNVNELEYA